MCFQLMETVAGITAHWLQLCCYTMYVQAMSNMGMQMRFNISKCNTGLFFLFKYVWYVDK
jgi:hypothetical protein